jgi:hypothetical protein
MEALVNIVVFLQKYVSALQTAVDTTAMELPGLVEQHIETLAKEKLHSSLNDYLDAVKVRMENYVLIVEMDEDNWIACAVEHGASAWSMNNPPNGKGHLNSPKAKTSKSGHKYAVVPMGKEVGGKAGPSEKSKRIQEKINQVMKRPDIRSNKWGVKSKLHTDLGGKMVTGVFPGGKIIESQQIETGGDPDISGLYRTRTFANAEEFSHKQVSKKGMPKWNLVLFRTISENPSSKQWQHPGITAVNILKDTELWTVEFIEKRLQYNIQKELKKMGIGV